MSFKTCLIKAQDYLEKNSLEDQISKERLYQLAKKLEASGADALTKAEFAAKMQASILEDETRLRQKKQAANAMSLLKREEMFRSVTENIEKWQNDIKEGGQLGDPKKMAYEAARAIIQGGSLRAGEASNLSLEKMAHANEGVIRDLWNRAIEPIKEVAAKGVLDKATIQELWALDHAEKLGQSGSEDALAYAKAIKATRDKVFTLKQATNPFLEAADEYLVKQSHNRERITADPSEAGKKAWLDMMDKTFSDKSMMDLSPAEKRAQYAKTYDEIASGSYGRQDGNLFKRQTEGRTYIAKDWQAFYEYNSKYGDGTLAETMDKSISRSSREIAQLDKWGPTPEATKDAFLDRVGKSLKGETKDYFSQNRGKLDEAYDVSMGSQSAPAYGVQATLAKGGMTLQYLAKTGGAFLRSQPDIAIGASLIRDLNGRNVFQNAAEIASHYYKSVFSSDYRDARLSDLSLFSSAANSELMRVMGSPENGPGTMASMVKKMGMLNLLNRHVDAMRAATGTVLSSYLGDQAVVKFGDLSQRWQQGLARYGISEPMWNVMRLATEDVHGRTMLTPEAVGRLPDEAIENFMRKSGQVNAKGSLSEAQLEYGKHQMQTALGTMINEHADLSSAHPDLRQRTFLYGDTTINDGKGQLFRMISQFKTAGLVQNDVYRRSYFSGETSKGDWSAVVQHAVMAMFLGTMGEYAKQLASGKTPESPATPEFAVKMATLSGAGGIFGDLLIDEMSGKSTKDRAYSVLKAAAGPVPSTLAEGGAILAQAIGGKKLPIKEAGNFALSQVPGQNLFYTKAALNYYVTNGIKEFLGPGYLHHLEQGVNKTPGLFGGHQEYFMGSPTH